MYLVVIGEEVVLIKCNDEEEDEIKECVNGDVYVVDEIVDVMI